MANKKAKRLREKDRRLRRQAAMLKDVHASLGGSAAARDAMLAEAAETGHRAGVDAVLGDLRACNSIVQVRKVVDKWEDRLSALESD